MAQNEGPAHALTPEECWEFLAENSLGRLVTSVRDVVDIVPVNYFSDGSSILFRTAQGYKLVELTINDQVVFEIDGFDDTMGWSVIVKGTAATLERQEEIEAAEALPLYPMLPTVKRVYVRITPTQITGLKFLRGAEPEPVPEPS